MKRKIFALLLSLCMVLTMMPSMALAEVNGSQPADYKIVLSSLSDLGTKDETAIAKMQSEKQNLGIIELALTQENREFEGYVYIAKCSFSGSEWTYQKFTRLDAAYPATAGDSETNTVKIVAQYVSGYTESSNGNKMPTLTDSACWTIAKVTDGKYTFRYTYSEEEYEKIQPNDQGERYYEFNVKVNNQDAEVDGNHVNQATYYFAYDKIAELSDDVEYDISYEQLIDLSEYKDENGNSVGYSNRMSVYGQGNEMQFTNDITSWYTCFYVTSSANNGRDARYIPNKKVREIRTYIGDEDDFVIQARHYGNGNDWFNVSEASGKDEAVKDLYTIEYIGAMKGFYPVYKITFDRTKNTGTNATGEAVYPITENYEFRVRYDGNDRYLNSEAEKKRGDVKNIRLTYDGNPADFSFDQYFLDTDRQWATGNVQYFDRVGETLTTKMIIRPAASFNVGKKIYFSNESFTYLENKEFEFWYWSKEEDEDSTLKKVEGDLPFTVTWNETDKTYSVVYDHPENDKYGPEYIVKYAGTDWANIVGEDNWKKWTDKTEASALTIHNESYFFTSKSTQYVDKIENGDEGKPYINAYYNGGGNVNTTEVIVEKGAMSGTATEKDVRIGTNQAVTDLSGSLVGNMKTANDENSVSVTMQNAKEETKGLSGSQKNIIDKDSTVAAVDFSITSENKDVAFGETGAARVYINLGREVPSEDLDEYYVYYIDDKGKATKIKAEKIEQTPDGEWEIIFTTNHFSTYIVSADGTLDQSSSSSSGSGSSGGSGAQATGDVTNKTEDKTGNTIATTTVTVKNTTTTAADGTKTVAAKVDTATANKIIEKAVENKSTEVVVNAATAATVTETAAGTKTEVAIPAAAVSQVAEKTEAAVTIKSDAAEVTLDKEAVKAVAEAAGTAGEVKLEVATIVQDEGKAELGLKLVTSKGNVSDFKGGSVSVTIKLNAKLAAKDVKCVYIDDNSVYHGVKGQKNADGTFTFKTGHFSSYAVMTAEEADKVILAQEAKAVKLTRALSLKARSAKTAKGYIKVTLAADEDVIKQIEDLGYTVKYKFYRSTKKAKAYVAKSEKAGRTYTNTAGKKGTKYYYKARVMVYDAEGTLVAKSELKQCRYAARTK